MGKPKAHSNSDARRTWGELQAIATGLREGAEQRKREAAEAARLSNDFRTAHAELDCPGIIGFWNLAVHEYFAVSWSIVWVTATEDVPTLRSHVERILGEAFGSG